MVAGWNLSWKAGWFVFGGLRMSPSLISESPMLEAMAMKKQLEGKVMASSVVGEGLMAESCAVERLGAMEERAQTSDFIYRSKLPDIDIPNHMPLADYCLEKAAQWADKVCLIDGNTGREHRYNEIELSTRRVAAGLAKLGVPQGGVIALCLPNCAEFVQVFLGAAKRGAIVTTANPFYTAAELEKQITASGATVVVTQSSYIEKLSGLHVQVTEPHHHQHFLSLITLLFVLFQNGSIWQKITAKRNKSITHIEAENFLK